MGGHCGTGLLDPLRDPVDRASAGNCQISGVGRERCYCCLSGLGADAQGPGINSKEELMSQFSLRGLAGLAFIAFFTTSVFAAPEYTTITMAIEVAKPASEVWAKVGGYCDISKWLNLDCNITRGDGGIGTVRVL